jgi:hypothetical protein
MKAIQLIISIIEEIVYSGRQSREYKYTAKMNKGKQTFKVQVHIKRDSYDFQSYAVIDVWKDSALEWSRIASIPYSQMKSLKGGNEATAFYSDRVHLMERAEQILF